MAEDANTQRIILGAMGTEYVVEDGWCRIRQDDGSLQKEQDGLTFVDLGSRARNVSLEDAVRRQVKLARCLPKTVSRQVSLVVDVAYEAGKFKGFIATSLSGGIALAQFLDVTDHDRRARVQVARNLCVAVRAALAAGRSLGRLSPDRILVDEKTCRVFIGFNYASILSSGEMPQYLRKQSTLPDPVSDLAWHVYCLVLRHSSGDLERGLWESRSGSLFSGPAPMAVRQAVLDVNPLSWGERMRERLRRVHRSPRLKDVPREVEPVLRAILLDGTNSSAYALATVLCEEFERKGGTKRNTLAVLAERFRGLLSCRLAREDAARLERRPWGLRGAGQASTFWLTTLWTSLALGTCAMMNEFAPLDGLFGLSSGDRGSGVMWQYPLAAVAGSAAYNVFAARRHYFKGYTAASYGWSVVVGIFFMTITRVAFLVLQGGAV
ncbi:MAG: hypothetical protein HFJ72_06005 [Adlercreutzia sp.]|nr:hypothetical protein [Adlercreutzia sp.]